jgi:hypothetical protein
MAKKFVLKHSSCRKFIFPSSEKGFVITVDAFLSVVVMILFVVLSLFFLSRVSSDAWNTVDLKNIVSDKASALEKSLIFEDSVKRVSVELLASSINSSPEPYCFSITIFNESLSPILHAIKAGCTKDATEIFSSERSLVVRSDAGSSFYIARVEGWVK